MFFEDKVKNLGIRKMDKNDLQKVLDIENLCFPSPWPLQAFEESLYYNESLVLISLNDTNNVLGFHIGIGVQDEYNICNIAISPEHQNKGLGFYLLEKIIELHYKKYDKYFLEVRKSNKSAIALYHKLGFKVMYIRKKYYSNPIEDALVMMFSF